MELLVRIKNQGPLQQRNWTNPRTGENVVISSVELTLSDGIDSFVAEATDQLAIAISQQPLNPEELYSVRCQQEVREWKSQTTGVIQRANSIRILKIQAI